MRAEQSTENTARPKAALSNGIPDDRAESAT